MSLWTDVYDSVIDAIDNLDFPALYRGHADASWQLLPSLARVPRASECTYDCSSDAAREEFLYRRFVARAGNLLPATDPWTVLCAMHEAGLPTRLLEWTTSFPAALHFALKDTVSDASIWILDVWKLRDVMQGSLPVPPGDINTDYEDCFVNRKQTYKRDVTMIAQRNSRNSELRGVFTLHANLDRALEDLAPTAVQMIRVPQAAREEARKFLALAGVSEFTLFPDLGGLAREMRSLLFTRSTPPSA